MLDTDGVHFDRHLIKNKNDKPLTCANKKEPNKTINFGLKSIYSPQAKVPLGLQKKRKKRFNNQMMLQKRLGEKRYNEIVQACNDREEFSYDFLREILNEDEEKTVGMFFFSLLNNSTPKTDTSLSKSNTYDSRFKEGTTNTVEKN